LHYDIGYKEQKNTKPGENGSVAMQIHCACPPEVKTTKTKQKTNTEKHN